MNFVEETSIKKHKTSADFVDLVDLVDVLTFSL